MKTKQEYEKVLKEMNDAFYGITFLNSQTRRFDDNLNLLRELVNEHFEEKQETNFEHYKDEIKKLKFDFAFIDGDVVSCRGNACINCIFNDKHLACTAIKMRWLYQWCEKKYKLTQFEYDLIQTYRDCHESCKLSEFKQLIELKDKGYFKYVDKNELIKDILENCEVIKND